MIRRFMNKAREDQGHSGYLQGSSVYRTRTAVVWCNMRKVIYFYDDFFEEMTNTTVVTAAAMESATAADAGGAASEELILLDGNDDERLFVLHHTSLSMINARWLVTSYPYNMDCLEGGGKDSLTLFEASRHKFSNE